MFKIYVAQCPSGWTAWIPGLKIHERFGATKESAIGSLVLSLQNTNEVPEVVLVSNPTETGK